MSFSTSSLRRYSRLRTSTLGRRRGGRRLVIVPLTVAGATSARGDFPMVFQASSRATVPNMSPLGTLHKARNADAAGSTIISSAALADKNPFLTTKFYEHELPLQLS